MGLIDAFALLMSLTAGFSYLNYRFFRLPQAIGVMLVALGMAVSLEIVDFFGGNLEASAREFLLYVDFTDALMHGLLSFLLFAGALHVNINDLAKEKNVIGILATVGVLVSTFIVGGIMQVIFQAFGFEVPLIYCLLFGALISPTDPIAVLSVLKSAKAPKALETKIAGESLFNDGVGVVIFLILLRIAQEGTASVSATQVLTLFFQEAVGGAFYGLGLGYFFYRLLRKVDNYQLEIMLTLAMVSGGYSLAHHMHLSGPIAIVVAGLFIGNQGRNFAMSASTREHLDLFWELVDEILNAILFVLMGLEVLILTVTPQYFMVGVIAIPVVLFARFLVISGVVKSLKFRRDFDPKTVRVLTWGGVRGGISIALALSLPLTEARDVILTTTYTVVVFSIVVQGLTIGKLIKS